MLAPQHGLQPKPGTRVRSSWRDRGDAAIRPEKNGGEGLPEQRWGTIENSLRSYRQVWVAVSIFGRKIEGSTPSIFTVSAMNFCNDRKSFCKFGLLVGLSAGLLASGDIGVLAACAQESDLRGLEHPDGQGSHKVATIEYAALVDSKRSSRSVPIKVHLPDGAGPFPIVVLSHGGGGNWDSNFAQAHHLASYGYAVLCVEHIGSNTKIFKKSIFIKRNLAEMTHNADEVLTRPRDISFAIDCATDWNKNEPQFKGKLDLERIGVLGHSFGSYTTLAVVGARPALRWLTPNPSGDLPASASEQGSGDLESALGPDLQDARVDAGVALSVQGPGEPFFIESSYKTIAKPVLGITGSKDDQQQNPASNRRRFIALAPPGLATFVWLPNVDHLAFSDPEGSTGRGLYSSTRADAQPVSRAATLLFFESVLRGNAQAAARINAAGLTPYLRGKVTSVEVLKN